MDGRGYRGIWHKVPIQGHPAWAARATRVRFRYIRVNPLIPGDMRNVPFSVPGGVARLSLSSRIWPKDPVPAQRGSFRKPRAHVERELMLLEGSRFDMGLWGVG